MILFVLLFGKEFAESWMVGRKVWDGRFGWKVSLEGSARSFAAEKFGSEGLVRRFDWKVYAESFHEALLKVRWKFVENRKVRQRCKGIHLESKCNSSKHEAISRNFLANLQISSDDRPQRLFNCFPTGFLTERWASCLPLNFEAKSPSDTRTHRKSEKQMILAISELKRSGEISIFLEMQSEPALKGFSPASLLFSSFY